MKSNQHSVDEAGLPIALKEHPTRARAIRETSLRESQLLGL